MTDCLFGFVLVSNSQTCTELPGNVATFRKYFTIKDYFLRFLSEESKQRKEYHEMVWHNN